MKKEKIEKRRTNVVTKHGITYTFHRSISPDS